MMRKVFKVAVKHRKVAVALLARGGVFLFNQFANRRAREGRDAMKLAFCRILYPQIDYLLKFTIRRSFAKNAHPLTLSVCY